MMDNLQESLVKTMEMVAGEYLTRAGYDRTIQATVLSCVDESTGKYRIKYQDSKFYAYAANIETKYAENSQVYILIPGNDMTMHKTILGAVKNEGLYGNKVLPRSARYLDYGINLITLKKDSFGLCSYKSKNKETFAELTDLSENANPKELSLYVKDTQGEYVLTEDTEKNPETQYFYRIVEPLNTITIFSDEEVNRASDQEKDIYYETDNIKINLAGIKEYILNNDNVDTLKIGGVFATDLPEEQRSQGNYGLKFVFSGKLAGEDNEREYTMTIQDMEGDPYRYFVDSEQTTYLQLGDFTFEKLKSITFYAENFPIIDYDGYHKNDIFLKGIIFQGCEALTNEEINGVYLKLTAPQGTIFYPYQKESNTQLSLIAQVYSGGTAVNANSNSLGYYWYEEAADEKDDIGGKGWHSLNAIDATTKKPIPGNNTYVINKADVPFYSKLYQSVAIYNAQRLTKTIRILNYSANYKMELYTPKTVFDIKEAVSAEVELKLYYRDKPSQEWQLITDFSNFVIKWYGEDSYKNYKILDTIERNKVLISDFNQFYKIHCTLYHKENKNIQGSETLTLIKTAITDQPFTLEIINDNGDFVYNEEGIAPTNASLNDPITIKPLRFLLYDNINQVEVDTSNIPAEKIIWSFPLKEESLISPNTGKEENGSLIVTGHEASFTLDETYSIEQNIRNRVKLQVNYGSYTSLITWIDINCRKEGENGTNGTGYSLTIEPIDEIFENKFVPTICFYKDENTDHLIPLKNISGSKWFNVSLWLHGSKIFTGSDEGLGVKDDDESVYKVTWEFKRHTQFGWQEKSLYNVNGDIFSINLNNGELYDNNSNTFITEDNIKEYLEQCCHIVQATVEYKGQKIIASQSIATLVVNSADSNDKTINLYSGFREVVYKSDGTQSKYKNNNPLTLSYLKEGKVEIIPENWVIWQPYGQYPIVNGTSTSWINSKDLILKKADYRDQGEEEYLTPADTYSGFCYTNAAFAEINLHYQNPGADYTYPFIHIPIHFYLNRYENKAINSWDGNAININEEDGIILSPQVGAGKKEEDNSFTGVVIGVSKVINNDSGRREEKTNTGLFGYTHGQQSIFLDSETGSATFGIAQAGQIKINSGINEYGEFNPDPNIQSGNYNTETKEEPGTGLSIGFGTNPYIYYGSRKFTVDPNGNVVMQDASVEGCFYARNKNTDDESEILIGVDPTDINKQRSSHIYLYDYYTEIENNETVLKQLSYIKMRPGNLDITIKDTSTQEDKSYLRFNDQKGLQLQGEFRCKTYNSDVVFSNSSATTQIEFWSYQDDDEIQNKLEIIETAKDASYERNVLSAIDIAKQALKIKYTDYPDKYIEDCPYSNDEIESFIKNWTKNFDLLRKNKGIFTDIIEKTKELIKYQNNIDDNKKLIQEAKKQIYNLEAQKVKEKNDGTFDFVDESELEEINARIFNYEEGIDTLTSEIKQLQIDKQDKESYIKNQLKEVGYHSIGNREYQDFIKAIGTDFDSEEAIKAVYEIYNIHTLLGYENIYKPFVPLFQIDNFSFDLVAILNELDSIGKKISAVEKYNVYLLDLKRYEQEEKEIKDGSHIKKTESKWSPSEFYFNVFNEEGDKVSSLSYDSDSQQLDYIGGVDFEAPPFARLRMTREMNNGNNASELYFKTFFLNEDGDLDIQNPKSQIVLQAGYLKVGAKTEPNAPESSLTMRNGKLELKNVEFAIKTYASDIAFTNKPSTTHIRLNNYEMTNEGEQKTLSSVRITPSLFAIQGAGNEEKGTSGSSLYYNPLNGRLNYSGNINVSNDNGIFRLDDRDMILRFGTTVSDYVDPEQTEVNERFSGVDSGAKVTDFRISSTGFSIRSYGKKSNKNIDTNNQIEYSNKDAKSVAEQWQDQINSGEVDENAIKKIRESFNKEIIEEDNIQTDNPQVFEENYWSNFIVPENEVEAWKASDLAQQESSISVPVKDFSYVGEGLGDYIINDDGTYTYVEQGNGSYTWTAIGTEESLEIPAQKEPAFIDSSEQESISANETWAETSGIYYNSKTGKFRLNGDFAVRNDHGSIILSDDLMRIMFKTYEKDEYGEDTENIASRMCISEDSFYFYSFGKVSVPTPGSKTLDLSHGGGTSFSTKTVDNGITGAITWRDGILRIVGSIYADSGYIGGWTIEHQQLSSASGNAVLDGATGRLYLSGTNTGSDSTKGDAVAGQVVSEFNRRRSRITNGQFFIEGIGQNAEQTKALEDMYNAFYEIFDFEDDTDEGKSINEEINKKLYNGKGGLIIDGKCKGDKVIKHKIGYFMGGHISFKDQELKDYINELKTATGDGSEIKHARGQKIDAAYKKFNDSCESYNNATNANTESDGSRWGHQAHLISGYGAAQGAMLASEGYRLIEDGETTSAIGKTEWYDPSEKENSVKSYMNDGVDRVLNNVSFGIDLEYERLLTGNEENAAEFENDSYNKCVASFIKQKLPEGDANIASLSFVKDRQENGFIYGTEIFPHVIKTQDVFLTDNELYGEYDSSSLVGILKELHQIPKKITYIDKETDIEDEYASIIEGDDAPSDNTSYIIEEWERTSKTYDLSQSADENGIRALERVDQITDKEYNIWKLTLEPSEENEDEVDVTAITLIHKYKEGNDIIENEMNVDLSGFIVHLPG